MGARLRLSLCACKTAWLAPESLVSMGPRPHLSFCAFKTTWLASESLVFMGLSPHLWPLHAKQRLWDQNYKSLWVTALHCSFCNQNSNFRTKITSLYGSQPSFVTFTWKTATFGSELQVSMGPALICGFCMQNSNFMTRITSLSGSQTSPMVFCLQKSVISTSLHGSQTSPVVLCLKTAWLAPELLFSMGPRPHLSFCAFKIPWLASELLVSMGPKLRLLMCECKTACLEPEWR